MKAILSKFLCCALLFFAVVPFGHAASGSDWPEWRGLARDGRSAETGLPTSWSKTGENLVWSAPYGGRSAPIVMGGRVFLFNTAGEGETMQERVLCLDANTGKLLWEHRLNVYESDVPPRRIAWSSPTGDPATGNVYVFGACNELTALSNDGKVLWGRSLTEEFGAWTTHGGRTVSPIIDGDLVIVSTVTDGWGELALRRHRYYAFDKRTGEAVWISTPGGRPFDTTYSTPIVATINGTRLMIAGAGDGSVNALKVTTGEPVWSYPVSKRGVNPGVVLKGTTAIISHPEENLDTSEMGLLAAVDAAAKGTIGKDQIKWAIKNVQVGPASPIVDGDRIYHLDAGANMIAFDAGTGRELWRQSLGTIQKASPVLADGKLYVGTENGKFFILKPGPDRCEVLDSDELESVDKVQIKTEAGDDLIASNEQIIASVAVSRGRIYLVSTKAIYCIGKKAPSAELPKVKETIENAPAGSQVAHVQVVPVDFLAKPGEASKFRVRLFDDRGRFIREEANATWSLDRLKGAAQGIQFTPASDAGAQSGMLKATVGGVTGAARVRVIPSLPLNEDFNQIGGDAAPISWINATGKWSVREVDGNKVLVKNPNPPAFKRTRSLIGPADWHNYTIEANVLAVEKRRQMGDAGVVAQRYTLALFGNSQRIELQSWQIEEKRTVKKPFAWKADTWYRLKLQVENLPDGKVRARGKAWLASESEPSAWAVERIDPIGNRQGSPGIFADAPNDVLIDNIKVTSNK
ncbi:MAG TPA: PQQ-binding-like beta-propeller repeat protein [Blastocatellia bacterium]|nr:PQQ-binding-like beta-propeller repeat protein [Blastocatellia bacterium]